MKRSDLHGPALWRLTLRKCEKARLAGAPLTAVALTVLGILLECITLAGFCRYTAVAQDAVRCLSAALVVSALAWPRQPLRVCVWLAFIAAIAAAALSYGLLKPLPGL